MASIGKLNPHRAGSARVAASAANRPLMSGDALVLEGVTRAFGALRAVDDVSLTVAAGQKYAVLGSNGAGKTTLFNAITGDFPPTVGRILFFGEDITALPPHERIRKGLRRTYQSSLLFKELSVRDNLPGLRQIKDDSINVRGIDTFVAIADFDVISTQGFLAQE